MPPSNYPSKTNVSLLALKIDDIQLSDEEIQKVIDKDGTTLNNIGHQYYSKGKYSNAFTWFLKAAAQNNSDAQIMVGHMYYRGNDVGQSYELAKKWYLKATHNNEDRNAQYFLGALYHLGQGVPKNILTAIEWFTKAAEQDDSKAQRMLGYIYENEEEIKDLQQALKWYMIADNNGCKATDDINRLITKGCTFEGEEKDDEKEEEAEKEPLLISPLYFEEELNDTSLDNDPSIETDSFSQNSQQLHSQSTLSPKSSDEHEVEKVDNLLDMQDSDDKIALEDKKIEDNTSQQRLEAPEQTSDETDKLQIKLDKLEPNDIEKETLEVRLEILERNKIELEILLQRVLNSFEQDRDKLESEIQQLKDTFDQLKSSPVKNSQKDFFFY